jgi:hypothetical protein
VRKSLSALALPLLFIAGQVLAQSLGNTGTIQGTVVDPSGAAIPGADISVHNIATGYMQSVKSDASGSFRLINLPPNPYHLEIVAANFSKYSQDVDIKTSVPIQVNATLMLAGSTTAVTVEGAAEALEVDPSAHVDADRSQLSKLPVFDPGGGLSKAITYSTGAVSADGNGFFHPLGDHAEVSYVIDGQPVTDQQSKVFSTQLPVSAVQSMTLTTGNPEAEFGDKTSLVAQVTTRTGLGAGGFFGNIDANYGSFGTAGGSLGLGWGSAKFGNFLAVDGVRSGRFLDSPELQPFHDVGNNQTLFDRLDFQPNGKDAFHLNLFTARNWIQIPNDYDQLAQDQRQRVLSWSIAPGYQHTFSSNSLFTINPYVRKDQFNYYPSADPFNDTPATQSQQRQLLNWGVKADVGTTKGHHTLKYGVDLKQTRLLENFQFGLTNPAYNSPCIDANGAPIGDPSLVSTAQCAAAGYQPNTSNNPNLMGAPFSPALLLYDLSRGGTQFSFHGTGNINQAAIYLEDSISWGNFNFTPGFRLDYYDGLVTRTGPQPRLGIAYNVKRTGTVLRASYARTFETPFNENLLLSSATGLGGLEQNVFGSASTPIQPGFRNQFNTGFQQALSRWVLLDAEYFWKSTHNAFDFSSLLNTTITFPIAWHNSKLDGFTGRLSTINIHGFQAYWTFGHTRARYFPPETGGLVPQGAPLNSGVFLIDHDQALQSTVNLRYQRKTWEYLDFSWRYDSGMVVSGVPDAGAALALTPNQQATIGLACNGVLATALNPLTNCVNASGSQGLVTSKLLTLPQGGYGGFPSQENDDHNPDRVNPRNILNLGIGTDNLMHVEKGPKIRASLTIENLTNKVAVYNFLSTFSGTHFLEPRTFVARLGVTF